MASVDNNSKIDRFLNVLHGDAKRSLQDPAESLKALKALKRDYVNPVIISHLRITSLFEFPPIKSNNRIDLQNFHQKLKIIIIGWNQ